MGKSFKDIKSITIILDFNNQVWRSFHATKRDNLTNMDGINVGCIIGLCKILRHAISKSTENNSTPSLVICEDRYPKRKHDLYKKYQYAFKDYEGEIKYKDKRHREGLTYNPVEICSQFMKCIPHTHIYMEGEEADDVMASYICKHQNDKIILYSSDKDMWQLLGKYKSLQINLGYDQTVNIDLMIKHFQTTDYNKIALHKMIKGDNGDNVKSILNYPFKKTIQAYDKCNGTFESYLYYLSEIYGENHPAFIKLIDNIPLLILNYHLVDLKLNLKYTSEIIDNTDMNLWNKLCFTFETPSLLNSPLLRIF